MRGKGKAGSSVPGFLLVFPYFNLQNTQPFVICQGLRPLVLKSIVSTCAVKKLYKTNHENTK